MFRESWKSIVILRQDRPAFMKAGLWPSLGLPGENSSRSHDSVLEIFVGSGFSR